MGQQLDGTNNVTAIILNSDQVTLLDRSKKFDQNKHRQWLQHKHIPSQTGQLLKYFYSELGMIVIVLKIEHHRITK